MLLFWLKSWGGLQGNNLDIYPTWGDIFKLEFIVVLTVSATEDMSNNLLQQTSLTTVALQRWLTYLPSLWFTACMLRMAAECKPMSSSGFIFRNNTRVNSLHHSVDGAASNLSWEDLPAWNLSVFVHRNDPRMPLRLRLICFAPCLCCAGGSSVCLAFDQWSSISGWIINSWFPTGRTE